MSASSSVAGSERARRLADWFNGLPGESLGAQHWQALLDIVGDPAQGVQLSDEDRDEVEVVIACCNGQMGREAAIEVISELSLAGFEIVRAKEPTR